MTYPKGLARAVSETAPRSSGPHSLCPAVIYRDTIKDKILVVLKDYLTKVLLLLGNNPLVRCFEGNIFQK